jgi:hypothetical protein
MHTALIDKKERDFNTIYKKKKKQQYPIKKKSQNESTSKFFQDLITKATPLTTF